MGMQIDYVGAEVGRAGAESDISGRKGTALPNCKVPETRLLRPPSICWWSIGSSLYAVKGNWQLDGTIQSKIMAMAFAMAAEIERDLISQRTKEALAARKRGGK